MSPIFYSFLDKLTARMKEHLSKSRCVPAHLFFHQMCTECQHYTMHNFNLKQSKQFLTLQVFLVWLFSYMNPSEWSWLLERLLESTCSRGSSSPWRWGGNPAPWLPWGHSIGETLRKPNCKSMLFLLHQFRFLTWFIREVLGNIYKMWIFDGIIETFYKDFTK